jgi:hypothetical protein
MVRVLLLALLAAAPGGAPGRAADQERAPAICVVARLGDAARDSVADLDVIRRIFLLRERFWPSGTAAHPVNLPASSALRERFSQETFGQSVQELVPYWNDRYFHGTRPPPTVASEAAVLLFIARTPGAVGYVEAPEAEDLPAGVARLFCLPEDDAGEASGPPRD